MDNAGEATLLTLDIRADILEALKSNGDWWRLRRLFRERLEACGWRDKLKRRFRRFLREAEQRAATESDALEESSYRAFQGPHSLNRIELDDLIAQAFVDLDLEIPESVQETMLREVRESVCAALVRPEDVADP
ncbi:hypothetical protein CCYA_CCYA08G2236 [Cyanidiococcus yangmingshanensis]|nr:hypothetical protein CCYA_CCYA08G2236 [Cyanidiococcus yangmingshanensis]